MKGIKNFEAQKDASLVPIRLDTWGHFIYLCIDPTAYASAYFVYPSKKLLCKDERIHSGWWDERFGEQADSLVAQRA